MNTQGQNLKPEETFCIDDLMDELYNYVKKELQNRGKSHIGVEILKFSDIENCRVRTNRLRLRQIFNCLLDNMISLIDRGYIFFGYHTGIDNIVSFIVDDTGMGIYKDTDFDLSIARGLVEQMGGKIRIEPTYDAGTAIKFDINCEVVE